VPGLLGEGKVPFMAVFRSRGSGYASARAAYWQTHGESWSLTGSLLASTLAYLGLFLAIAAASGTAALLTGLDTVIARAGSLILLPYFAAIILLSAGLARAVGHIRREVVLGAVMMAVMGPLLSLLVAYGLSVSPAAVVSAAVAVGGSLVVTAAIAYISPWDLSRLSGLALVALLGLIVTQVLALFLAPVMGLVVSPVWFFIGILVFELYLVVDLSRLRAAAPYGPNDALAVFLALGLAMDIINLFMYFVELFVGGAAARRR
jgi:FtsH-binding integral membrane protein